MEYYVFDLKVKSLYPKKLDLKVESSVYYWKNGQLTSAKLEEEEFDPEKHLVFFDEQLSASLKISYNDVTHGEYSIKAKKAILPAEVHEFYVVQKVNETIYVHQYKVKEDNPLLVKTYKTKSIEELLKQLNKK